MSDKQTKRPAHEVIIVQLQELAQKYRALTKLSEGIGKTVIICGLILCIGQLASVLANIDIPEQDREMVIRSLRQNADIINAVPTGPDETEVVDILTSLAEELQAA